MKKVFPLLFPCVLLLLYGCERDYDFRQEVTPRIVVNSLINPDEPITVDLWWSANRKNFITHDPSKTIGKFERVLDATVVIYEDGEEVFRIVSADEAIGSGYYPSAGKEYSITVELEGHDKVSASTTIPTKPAATCEYIEKDPGQYSGQNFYGIDNVIVGNDAYTLYIAVYNHYEYDDDATEYQLDYYNTIWAMTPYADKFNMIIDNYDVDITGSTEEYSPFMRIPGHNISKMFPLTLSTGGIYGPAGSSQDVYVIAASREYDKYQKSYLLYSWYTETDEFLAHQTHSVYTNIKNGLGIFAGFSQAAFIYQVTE